MSTGNAKEGRRIVRQMEDLPLAADETVEREGETKTRPPDAKAETRGDARRPHNNQPEETK